MLEKKIINKNFSVAIIGLGYVGLPLAVRYLKKKIKVYGIDNDIVKIKKLRLGKSYINSLKNSDLNFFKKNKSFVSNTYDNIEKSDVIIICLPTPLKNNNYPNMDYLFSCARNLKNILKGEKLIILESTVYPGASENFIKKIELKDKIGKKIYFSYSPERENPGDKKFSYNITPKVLAGYSKKCANLAKNVYRPIVKKIHIAKTLKIAEMSKLLENIYRAINIALVNEMKIISDKLNIDIHEVIKAASTKNFGFVKFEPGPGYGGHCIPIDPIYLSWAAKKKGYEAKFIKTSLKVNNLMPRWIFNKIKNHFNKEKIRLKKILILGISYKKNVNDDRESPSYILIDILKKNKISFDYYDPYFFKLKKGRNNQSEKKRIKLSKNNISKYDCSILMTDHDKINYKKILNFSKLIFDCRGVYKKMNVSSKKIINC